MTRDEERKEVAFDDDAALCYQIAAGDVNISFKCMDPSGKNLLAWAHVDATRRSGGVWDCKVLMSDGVVLARTSDNDERMEKDLRKVIDMLGKAFERILRENSRESAPESS